MSENPTSYKKVTFEDFKNILAQELDYLGIPKKEWNQYLRELIRDSSEQTEKNSVNPETFGNYHKSDLVKSSQLGFEVPEDGGQGEEA